MEGLNFWIGSEIHVEVLSSSLDYNPLVLGEWIQFLLCHLFFSIHVILIQS